MMQRKSVSILSSCLAIALCSSAFAGQVSNATITSVTAVENDAWFVSVDLPVNNPAACATQTVKQQRFAIQASTPGGKAMIATLLDAFAMLKIVNIWGR